MKTVHREVAGGRIHERFQLDRVGLGLVEVSVAMGLMGVVVAGVMGVISMQQKATQNSTQNTQSNMMIQHIASLLGDSARCADALKVNNARAQFPMGAAGNNPITIPVARMNRVVANGFDATPANWIQIAQTGTTVRGLRLASIIATPQGPYEPLTPTTGVRQFELTFEFRPDTTGPERSLGSQVFTRGIGLRVTTVNPVAGTHPSDPEANRWRTIERCSVFQDNGQSACEAMGYTWEQGNNPPCQAKAGVFVQQATNRAGVMSQLAAGPDGPLASGIGTDDNIYAGADIRSGRHIAAAQNLTAGGAITAGGNISTPGNVIANEIRGGRRTFIHDTTTGWSAFDAVTTMDGNRYPVLHFYRAQGTSSTPTNLGVGGSGIMGAVVGSGYYNGNYRPVGNMRFLNANGWSSNSYPTTWELFVARAGWDAWNNSSSPGTNSELTYSPASVHMPALRVTADQTLELGNELHFGKFRRKIYGAAGDTHAQNAGILPGGYIAVDGNDIEFGSQDQKLRHIAFYNRALANAYHMDTSHGTIRSIGSKNLLHPKKPNIALLSEDGTATFHHPAVLHEAPTPQYYGPAELVMRKGGDNAAEATIRLIINGDTLGNPAPGKVLTSLDAFGNVTWADSAPAGAISCEGTDRIQLWGDNRRGENMGIAFTMANLDCSNTGYIFARVMAATWPSDTARVTYRCCR